MAGKRGNQKAGPITRTENLLKKNPKKLYTRVDTEKALKLTTKEAGNSLWWLWKEGRIQRHVEKTEDGLYQYAYQLPKDKVEVYKPGPMAETMKQVSKRRKKKGGMPSAREVRAMFAQAQNQIATLEDMVMQVMEEYETMEKKVNRLMKLLEG